MSGAFRSATSCSAHGVVGLTLVGSSRPIAARFDEAMAAAEGHSAELRVHNLLDVGQKYMKFLIEKGPFFGGGLAGSRWRPHCPAFAHRCRLAPMLTLPSPLLLSPSHPHAPPPPHLPRSRPTFRGSCVRAGL